MFDLFWNLHQQQQIGEVCSDVAQAKAKSSEASLRLVSLENNLRRLMLINQAMWELLRGQTSVTDEQLFEKIEEIDLRDGRLDGQFNPATVRQCSHCGRTLSRSHPRCIYCGQPGPTRDPFETIS